MNVLTTNEPSAMRSWDRPGSEPVKSWLAEKDGWWCRSLRRPAATVAPARISSQSPLVLPLDTRAQTETGKEIITKPHSLTGRYCTQDNNTVPACQTVLDFTRSWEGKLRHIWLIPIADWTYGCASKTVRSLENTCHTWALLRWSFTKSAISSVRTFTFTFTAERDDRSGKKSANLCQASCKPNPNVTWFRSPPKSNLFLLVNTLYRVPPLFQHWFSMTFPWPKKWKSITSA